MTIYTADQVTTLATAVADAAKGQAKVSRLFKEIAFPAADNAALQGEVAELLTSVRREVISAQENYCKWLKGQHSEADAAAVAVAGYKRSLVNALNYASKVAGDAANCLFAWDKESKVYGVKEKKAANEPSKPTATGKDANSAGQAADVIAAAAAAPELSKADRMAKLDGAIAALVNSGFTFAEIEAAVHARAMADAAAAADAAINAANLEPKAPAVLVEKLEAAGVTGNGIRVRKPRKAA